MTAPLDAALNAVVSQGEDADVARPFVVNAIDAWLRATVAHQPCSGAGILTEVIDPGGKLRPFGHFKATSNCPGPHTRIIVGHRQGIKSCSRCHGLGDSTIPPCRECGASMGEILYADPDRVGKLHDDLCYHLDADDGCRVRIALALPLPSDWTLT